MSKKAFIILFSIIMFFLITMVLGIFVLVIFGTDILCYIGGIGAVCTLLIMIVWGGISLFLES